MVPVIIPNTASLTKLESRWVFPSVMSSYLSDVSGLYQQYMFANVAIFYVPSCSTQTPGSVILTFQNSPLTSYTPTSNISDLSSRTHFTMLSYQKGGSLPLKANFARKYLNGAGETTQAMNRWLTDWTMEIWAIGNGDGPTTAGYWGVTYDVLFFTRQATLAPPMIHMGADFLSTLCMFTQVSFQKCYDVLIKMISNGREREGGYLRDITFNQAQLFHETESVEKIVARLIGWDKMDYKQLQFIKAFVSTLASFNSKLHIFAHKKDKMLFCFLEHILENFEAEDNQEIEIIF